VLEAGTGAGAIVAIRELRPDLVVIDPELPDMCGFDAVNLIRKDQKTANMPVIALTALNSAEGRQKAADANFAHYLTKLIIYIYELRDSMRLHLSCALISPVGSRRPNFGRSARSPDFNRRSTPILRSSKLISEHGVRRPLSSRMTVAPSLLVFFIRGIAIIHEGELNVRFDLTRWPTHAREEYFPIAFYMWLQEVLAAVDTVQDTQP
jgi:CheY-like chemotaxis protein